MLVALAHDTALALLDLRGEPRHVEMVECLEAKLNVNASAHRIARSKKNADLAGIEIVEEALFRLGLPMVLHVGDLGRRHAETDEFVANPAVGGEAAAGLDADGAEIGENELAGAGLVEGPLAILLSLVLAPVVGILQRIHVPRGLAVVSVVVLAFAFIFAMGSLLATQLTQLAGDLPRYQSTISEKIKSFRDTKAGRGTLERASDMLKDLGKELDKPKDAAAARASRLNPEPQTPVPVEVRQPDPGALESLRTLISPLVHPLATTGIIIIFVIFILLQREDLRNRLIRLAGSYDLQRTTAALDDAAARLSRLFLTQLIVNGAFGVVIGTGLWLIGIPSAILWGILAAVLRFVPYIGA